MNASLEAAKPRRKMRTGAKVALGTAVTLTLLLAGLADIVAQRNELPNIVIPVSPEPSPNARQFFLAAAGALQDSNAIGVAISDKPGPLYPHTTNGATSGKPISDSHIYTLAEKEKFVRENQDALAILRSGFAYQYSNKTSRSFNDLFPEYAQLRATARLLALEGQVKRARGDYSGAVNSELDSIEMGVMMSRNGVLIADLVGIACEAIGRKGLWDDYKHLDAAQSLAALRRLEKIEARRFPFADVMEEEKRLGQAGLLEAFRSPESVAADAVTPRSETDSGEPSTGRDLAWKISLNLIGKRVIFENYTRYMNQFIQNGRQSYGLHLPPPPLPSDPLNQLLLPVYDNARTGQAGAETQNRLLAVSLALRAYQKSRGAFPPSLDAIRANVPAIRLTDPFAAQGNLRYRRDGARYVLYSVGPDGRDDGGKPIYDKTKALSSDGSDRLRYITHFNSVGDVVAGVNE